MQNLLALFKSLPTPLKIGAAVVGLLLAWTVAQSIPGLLTMSALAAWGLVIATVLYASGMAPWLGSLPVVGPYITALAGAAARQPSAPAPGGPVATPSAPIRVNRGEVAQRAIAQMQSLHGRHPAVSYILDEMAPFARASAREKKRLFGLTRPWLVVIHGPRGVGKSSTARALADLLIGLEVVERPATLSVEPPPPGRADTEWSQVLERGLDGVLLLDNADWLAEQNLRGTAPVSHIVLASLINLAERRQGGVAVVVSLTTEAFDTAFSSSADVFLKRMSYRDLECVALDDQALASIFESHLAASSIRCGTGTREEIVRFSRGARSYLAAQFDHAEAMRRASERLVERLKVAGRSVAEPADVRPLINERL